MAQTHSVAACRWGEPTLQLPRPLWYQASDNAWSCTRGGELRVLRDPAECLACEAWQPVSSPAPAAAGIGED